LFFGANTLPHAHALAQQLHAIFSYFLLFSAVFPRFIWIFLQWLQKKKKTNNPHRQLNGNALVSLDGDCLGHLQKLRTLRLEGNLFYRIPTNALAGLRTLEAL